MVWGDSLVLMEILFLYLDATQIYSLSLSNSFIEQIGNLLQDLEQKMIPRPPSSSSSKFPPQTLEWEMDL